MSAYMGSWWKLGSCPWWSQKLAMVVLQRGDGFFHLVKVGLNEPVPAA